MLVNEKNISWMLEVISTARTDEMSLKALLVKVAKALYMEYMGAKCLFFHLAWVGRLRIDLNSKIIELSKPLYVEVVSLSEFSSGEVSRHA
ncbi:hypothetical protein D3C80_1573050 [compost metagenome]